MFWVITALIISVILNIYQLIKKQELVDKEINEFLVKKESVETTAIKFLSSANKSLMEANNSLLKEREISEKDFQIRMEIFKDGILNRIAYIMDNHLQLNHEKRSALNTLYLEIKKINVNDKSL